MHTEQTPKKPQLSPLRRRRLGLMLVIALVSLPGLSPAADPSKTAEFFESSFAHEASGNTDRALKDVMSILRQDKKNYVATLRAGWLYYLKAKYGESITSYKKAGTLAPKALEPQLGLMLPLMAALRWADAERVGKRILKRAPQDYLAQSRLAFIAYSQAKYKVAEEHYKQVLSNYPSDVEMMLGLGWTYLKQGRKGDAKPMFKRVLRIRQSNLNAQAGLAASGP